MEVSSNPAAYPPSRAKFATAATQIEAAAKIAICCIFLSWFFLDTLVVNLGSFQHGVRFLDASALIADPSRLFFGVNGWAHRVGFGLLCVICLGAPVLPHWRRQKALWLAYLAPLTLMAVCGALLMWRSSGEFIAVPNDAGRISGNLLQFANGLVHHGSALIARHVSIGVGGYLAIAAGVLLALRGIRRFRGDGIFEAPRVAPPA